MHQSNIKSWIARFAPVGVVAVASLLAAPAQGATPGINGTASTGGVTFNLTAQTANLNQPDGQTLYSWGYGCGTAPTPGTASPGTSATVWTPGAYVGVTANASCPTSQVPGPTLVVTEGQVVTVNLYNGLPTPVGNTSILFNGFQVCAGTISGVSKTNPAGTCTPTTGNGVAGLLAQEAAPGATVSYQFVATSPGTRAYYSGTQSDLQVEMGLYGAIVVLPANPPALCSSGVRAANLVVESNFGEHDFALAHAAYDHPGTCYDREYLFQFAEADPVIHKAALAQITTLGNNCTPGAVNCRLAVPTEPWHPAYFMINGRSMPDDMDPNYGAEYPNQPYNGNPHMHPGEMVLLRVIGQGRWEHPFHEHANHVRILARDGNLILGSGSVAYDDAAHTNSTNATSPALAGILLFTTDTFPGQAFDGIFYFSGRGLNWDMFGHNPTSADPLAKLPCYPDMNGYNTGYDPSNQALTHPEVRGNINYYEWCQDHNKPVEANPLGDVAGGGPATLPNPNIFTNGAWYGGSPYFGPDATLRSDTTLRNDAGANSSLSGAGNSGSTGLSGCVTGTAINTVPVGSTPNCTNLQPANTQANPATERGWAFMWHSHNEREITTNNVFPGGMLMMMLVDSREFQIDESN
jgi:FtsP/CotA-like multicopper oxidase with cupredoxin domain